MTKVYKNVTQERCNELLAQASSAGLSLQSDPSDPTNPNKKVAKKFTITAKISYDASSSALTVDMSGFGSGAALAKLEKITGLS